MRRLIALPCLLALSAPAMAAETGKTYAELSGIYTFISDSGYEANPGALKLTLGHELTNWLAIEGFAGTGFVDSSFNVGAANVNISIDNFYGAHLRPFYRSSQGYEVFARAGYFHGRLSASVNAPGLSASAYGYDSSFTFGVGGAIPLSDNLKLTIDWTRFYQAQGTTVNGLGAGLRLHF